MADAAMMDVTEFDVIDYDNYDTGAPKGGGSGKSYAPPPEGRYTAILPIFTADSFDVTQAGHRKVLLDPLMVQVPGGEPYAIRFASASAKKYSNRNGSQALDVLRAAGIDARPKNDEELKQLFIQASGRPIELGLVWEAWNKDAAEVAAKGEQNFPTRADGTRQSYVVDAYDSTKKWFANGKVKYYVDAVAKK